MTELPEGRFPSPGNARGTLPFVLVSYAAALPVAVVIMARYLGFGADLFTEPTWEDISVTLFILAVLLGVLAVPIGAAVIAGHLVSAASRQGWVRFLAIALVSATVTAPVVWFFTPNSRELFADPSLVLGLSGIGIALAAGAVAPWFAGFASPRREFAATVPTTGPRDDTEEGRTPEDAARDEQ
ncbi:hypothetical protein EV140_2009 [Microcella alkaliphila]|uniref:Uncharacterized protein n=1 Tax=Microcella alkaliphila TaxID=279828 RepID=A0A4Q7TGJ3_9MICO|nr:hypothetical protein [Microcella alkaliphila]RZT59403.1 hypothetical protein EV140_2009 [Microcella alkaliphila]